MRQIFLDTETTGLSAEGGDRIIEIGCLEMVNRRMTGQNLHHYLNPDRSSHPDALKVHGITDEFLADKPRFADVAQQLHDYLKGAEIIIHNASFDLGFLDAELKRVGLGPTSSIVAKVTDSLLMAREMFPGKSNSLDALCRRLEVDNTHRNLHGALLDAGLLAEVYVRMTRGQGSLVIDDSTGGAAQGEGTEHRPAEIAGIVLPIIPVSPEEAEAHAAVLADLDKASGGKTLWRSQAWLAVPQAVA
jgi:DNA polymerase III subunit epsilon